MADENSENKAPPPRTEGGTENGPPPPGESGGPEPQHPEPQHLEPQHAEPQHAEATPESQPADNEVVNGSPPPNEPSPAPVTAEPQQAAQESSSDNEAANARSTPAEQDGTTNEAQAGKNEVLNGPPPPGEAGTTTPNENPDPGPSSPSTGEPTPSDDTAGREADPTARPEPVDSGDSGRPAPEVPDGEEPAPTSTSEGSSGSAVPQELTSHADGDAKTSARADDGTPRARDVESLDNEHPETDDSLLDRHEEPVGGGHTIKEHVGKTDQELLDAQKTKTEVPTSTFYDKPTADSAARENIAANQDKIQGWLATGEPRRGFNHFDHGRDVGRWLPARAQSLDQAVDVQSSRVFLVRDDAMPEGYNIRSSYPISSDWSEKK